MTTSSKHAARTERYAQLRVEREAALDAAILALLTAAPSLTIKQFAALGYGYNRALQLSLERLETAGKIKKRWGQNLASPAHGVYSIAEGKR